MIPLYQQTVLLTRDMKLYPVTTFHLKGHIVAGRGVMMMEPIGIILVMPGHIRALGHDRRWNGQSG